MASAPEMAGITADSVRALIQAGRLRELIDVGPNASPKEVKAACKRALLRHHPDKGGDPEVFKVIQPALQNEENLYAFQGGAPPWARRLIAQITGYRDKLEKATQKLQAARAEATAHPSRARRGDVESKERVVENARADLDATLSHFKARYVEHVENEEKRQRLEAERRAAEEAALERERVERVKELGVARTRKWRGPSTRFPSLPHDANIYDKQRLSKLAQKYRTTCHAAAQRARRGKDARDLLAKATELLKKGHALVKERMEAYHIEDLDLTRRFPRFPAGDARKERANELKRQLTRLKDRLRRAKTIEHGKQLQNEVDEVLDQALSLYQQGTEAPMVTPDMGD